MHALLLLHRALPERRRPARRDREARRRGDQGRHRPRHGRQAREVVHPLDGDHGLAARDRARAEDAGRRLEHQADEVRENSRSTRRRASSSRRMSRRTSARRASSTSSCTSRAGSDTPATCRASRRSEARARPRGGPRSVRARLVPAALPAGGAGRAESRPKGEREHGRGMKQVAYYKGCLASMSAKELDTSTQALAPRVGLELIELESVTCCGAGDIHEAEPDYYLHLNARILAYAEAGLRHAADGLQRLHPQPPAGELHAARATRTCSTASTRT